MSSRTRGRPLHCASVSAWACMVMLRVTDDHWLQLVSLASAGCRHTPIQAYHEHIVCIHNRHYVYNIIYHVVSSVKLFPLYGYSVTAGKKLRNRRLVHPKRTQINSSKHLCFVYFAPECMGWMNLGLKESKKRCPSYARVL